MKYLLSLKLRTHVLVRYLFLVAFAIWYAVIGRIHNRIDIVQVEVHVLEVVIVFDNIVLKIIFKDNIESTVGKTDGEKKVYQESGWQASEVVKV